MTLHGLDLAKITEAISDESLTDLGQAVKNAFRGGKTAFQPVDHPLTIREGNLTIDNFTLQSETANLVSDGDVSFARWVMDLKNTIQFTGDYDDLPAITMSLKGPLHAPEQNIVDDVLKSFIANKYGGKIQKIIDKELGEDNPAGALINDLLGLPQNNQTPQDEQGNQAPQPQQPAKEEQILKGLIDQFAR